jgi:hypothetical protein
MMIRQRGSVPLVVVLSSCLVAWECILVTHAESAALMVATFPAMIIGSSLDGLHPRNTQSGPPASR